MNGRIVTVTANNTRVAVGAANAIVLGTLLPGKLYQFISTTACRIKQGFGAQTAALASANQFVPPNTFVYLHGSNGESVYSIQDAAGGFCVIGLVSEI